MILQARVTVVLVLFILVAGAFMGGIGVAAGNTAGSGTSAGAASAPDKHVVEPGDSIQAAIDDASTGDRILLAPGSYEQRFHVEKTLFLVAPDGAVLNGTTLGGDGAAVTIRGDAAPVISGLTITGYAVGVDAGQTRGDWEVRNVTVSGIPRGVEASGTSGDWAVRRSTIHRANNGLMAVGSTGAWVISNTTISEYGDDAVGAFASEGAWVMRDNVFRDSRGSGCSSNAIGAENTSGRWTIADTRIINSTCSGVATWHATNSWTVQNVTIVGAQFGVGTRFATGDWTVVSSTIEHADVGVWAPRTAGDWTVRDVTIRDSKGGVSARGATGDWSIRDSLFAGYGKRPGVQATDTAGRWQIRNTSLLGQGNHDVVATGASPAGNATGNWWGGTIPACVGNVTCSNALNAPPGETPTSTSTATKTESSVATTVVADSGDTQSGGLTTVSSTRARSPGMSLQTTLAALATVGAIFLAFHRYEESGDG